MKQAAPSLSFVEKLEVIPILDEVLLKRAQKGDPAAFEALFTPLEGRVYRTCVHVLGPGEDAKDCAQDVLLKAFRTLKDFRGDCALESWLHRLCITTCLDARRYAARRETESLDAMGETGFTPPDKSPTPYEALEKKERMALLRRAIGELPADQRMAFTLTVLEEQPYEDTAAQLGIAVGTVKSRVNRAREKLWKFFRGQGELSPPSSVQQNEGRAK